MAVSQPGTSFLRGLLNDFASLAVILLFVLVLTGVMGVTFVLVYLARNTIVYIGVILSIIFVPLVICLGLYLNLSLFKKIPETKTGLWRHFRIKEVPFSVYTTKYRNRFILQRLAFLGIMIALFFVFLISTGLLALDPVICCICSPLFIPSILITVTIPAIAWMSFTYAFDPYEPEPRAIIILGVLWGMMSTFPSLFFNTFNGMWMEPLGISTAVFSAPIFEEFFKSLGFFLIFSHIKDESDGVIYGATFGAGFSLIENLVYGGNSILASGGIGFILTISFRSFFNIIGHMIGPVIIGLLIGAYRYRYTYKRKKKIHAPLESRFIGALMVITLIIVGYTFSAVNHGVWNYLAGVAGSGNMLAGVLLLFIGLLQIPIFIGIVLFAYYLATERYNKGLNKFRSYH